MQFIEWMTSLHLRMREIAFPICISVHFFSFIAIAFLSPLNCPYLHLFSCILFTPNKILGTESISLARFKLLVWANSSELRRSSNFDLVLEKTTLNLAETVMFSIETHTSIVLREQAKVKIPTRQKSVWISLFSVMMTDICLLFRQVSICRTPENVSRDASCSPSLFRMRPG